MNGSIGFTGTRHGMTEAQLDVVEFLVAKSEYAWVRHGDCVGADHDFHRIARRLDRQVVLHPPSNDKFRAFCDYDHRHEPFDYHARNRHIVRKCDILIATPHENEEQLSGGTWYTVHYADGVERATLVVWPNGSLTNRKASES